MELTPLGTPAQRSSRMEQVMAAPKITFWLDRQISLPIRNRAIGSYKDFMYFRKCFWWCEIKHLIMDLFSILSIYCCYIQTQTPELGKV